MLGHWRKKTPNLCDDLVEDIQLRLPIKSLVRFQLVCKAWRHRFQKNCFVCRYQKIQGNSWVIFQHLITRENPIYTFLNAEEVASRSITMEDDVWICHPGGDIDWSAVITVGSCNGLLCLIELSDWTYRDRRLYRIMLWNPTTRSARVLDKPEPEVYIPGFHSHGRYKWYGIPGFGYDAKFDDYMIVWLKAVKRSAISWILTEARIYSFRNNSWKRILGLSQNCNLLPPAEPNAFIEGVCHWLNGHVMLSLDTRREVLRVTELPAVIDPRITSHFYIHLITPSLHGFPAIITQHRASGLGIASEIWVLREVGARDSWTLVHRLGVDLEFGRPLGLCRYSQVLMDCGGGAMTYDLKTKQLQEVAIRFNHTVWSSLGFSPSLVPIGGRPEHEEGIFRGGRQYNNNVSKSYKKRWERALLCLGFSLLFALTLRGFLHGFN